jgi:hypothetical protein
MTMCYAVPMNTYRATITDAAGTILSRKVGTSHEQMLSDMHSDVCGFEWDIAATHMNAFKTGLTRIEAKNYQNETVRVATLVQVSADWVDGWVEAREVEVTISGESIHDWDDNYSDDYPEIRVSFCDDYAVHEPHHYRAINGESYDCWGFTQEELNDMIAAEQVAPCEHGMSASLCNGPQHY